MTEALRAATAGVAALLWLAAGTGPLPAQGGGRGALDAAATVRFRLGEPIPNPFRERVEIPFVLGEGPEPRWRTSIRAAPPGEGGEAAGAPQPARAVVSVRVYNLLHQAVAWAREAPAAGTAGRPVRDVAYPVPGSYTAVWDGRSGDGHRVAPGPYFVEIVVDGWTAVRKVLLMR